MGVGKKLGFTIVGEVEVPAGGFSGKLAERLGWVIKEAEGMGSNSRSYCFGVINEIFLINSGRCMFPYCDGYCKFT